ncbi:MAG: hypothetical protein DMF77_16990, partial [Acidobacteria bacterium]
HPDLHLRFEREARIISRLSHPHICAVYDVGEHDGSSFLVMEYLEGENLAERLGKGPLPLPEALRYATEIVEALDEAHREGIVHRDLKPPNVMLTRKGAKLLDFGIAKLRAPAGSKEAPTATATETTGEGVIVGTPHYMSPEQLEGEPVDARTDIFAFGVVLYEMVSGRKPFEAPSRAGLIAAILERDPPSLSRFQPLSPPWLEALVLRCLAKRPADRWQSCADLLVHLEAGIGGRALERPALGITRRRVLWMTAASVALLAVVSMIALAVSGARRWRTASPKSATFTQLTDQAGPELYASLSPDGKSFVYQSRATGNWDIYFQRVKGKT